MNSRYILPALPPRKRISNVLCKLNDFRSSSTCHWIWVELQIASQKPVAHFTVVFVMRSFSFFSPKKFQYYFITFDLVAHACSCIMTSSQIDTLRGKHCHQYGIAKCVRFDMHCRILWLKVECGCTQSQCHNVCVRMTYLWQHFASVCVSAQCLCFLPASKRRTFAAHDRI